MKCHYELDLAMKKITSAPKVIYLCMWATSYKLLVTMFLAMDSQGESRKDTTSGSSKKLQKTDGIFWYTKQTAKI